MESETTFKETVTASEVSDDNMQTYIRYNNNEILPNMIDGLKLIHRRILKVLGVKSGIMKGTAITGAVMQQLHPHGDSGIYDAVIRLAQPFSQVHPYVGSKGNVGAYGGGYAAAARYLEVYSTEFAEDLFFNRTDQRVLSYIPSEIGHGVEPSYLIPVLPTALLTGTVGISVAYKSMIPHFNFNSICQLVPKYIELRNKSITHKVEPADIAKYCLPDFPTHNLLRNEKYLLNEYAKGNYVADIVTDGIMEITPEEIHLRAVPHGVPFESIYQKLGPMMNTANFISANFTSVDDLSTGYEWGDICFKMKRGVNPFAILDEFKRLCGFTQTFHPIWNFVDKDGCVCTITPPQLLDIWYKARHRAIHSALSIINNDLFKEYRKLDALVKIVDHTDQVLKIIKESKDKEEAIPILANQFKLTREQAAYITDLHLHQITHQGKDDLLKSREVIIGKINEMKTKFTNIDQIICADAQYMYDTYGEKSNDEYKCIRRTELPRYIGAIRINEYNGYVQFSSYQELCHLFKRWNKNFDVEVILYPEGSNKYLVHAKNLLTDEDYDLPKEFTGTNLEVMKLKPRSAIKLQDGYIARIDGIVNSYGKDGKTIHVGDRLTVINKDLVVDVISSTDIVKRNMISATGTKTDIIYIDNNIHPDMIVATSNTLRPNEIVLSRIQSGARLKKNMMGKTHILGIWKYGDPICVHIAKDCSSRCTIKHLLIKNPEKLFEDRKEVICNLNKHRTSDDRSLFILSKGVDILSDVSIKMKG